MPLGDNAITTGDETLNLSVLALVDDGDLSVSSYDAVAAGDEAFDLSVCALVDGGFFGDDLLRVHGDESLGRHDD